MASIEEKIRALRNEQIDESNIQFNLGWNSAIRAAIKVLKENQHLLLEEASESKTLFVDDDEVRLKTSRHL